MSVHRQVEVWCDWNHQREGNTCHPELSPIHIHFCWISQQFNGCYKTEIKLITKNCGGADFFSDTTTVIKEFGLTICHSVTYEEFTGSISLWLTWARVESCTPMKYTYFPNKFTVYFIGHNVQLFQVKVCCCKVIPHCTDLEFTFLYISLNIHHCKKFQI
jgi:hypothetical protein